MQRPQTLGLIVLMCLSASTVYGAEKRKSAEEQRAEQQRQAEEDARKAEELKQQAQAELEEQQKPAGPEPKLNLPIRYFVYTAVFSGLGYATGFLSRGPERDLRDPAKHPTQDKTLSLYRRARYGGILSKGFYSLSGAMGAYASYKTQSAVREYLKATAQQQQSAALEREAKQRLAQAQSSEEQKAIEVANALMLPPEPVATELLITAPEPPPLQAGFFLGPAGDASVSLSVSF
jgi:predicted Zn-dependent peptidase